MTPQTEIQCAHPVYCVPKYALMSHIHAVVLAYPQCLPTYAQCYC